MKDLRVNEEYLSKEEISEWNERNIIYNTLWFYVYKSKLKPDIEYSNQAIEIYRSNTFYNTWDCYQRSKKDGCILVKPDKMKFNADLMTGWWNPFKKFVNWNSRKQIVENIKNGNVPSKNDKDILNWLMIRSKANEKECESLIEFMRMIYTAGNIIPAPLNWRGNGPDTWDYKLFEIIKNTTLTANKWNEYICKYEGENREAKLKKFISVNHLEMYFSNLDQLQLKQLWGKENAVWTKATKSEWAEYFNNAKNCIEERTNKITSSKS